jgi:hypothetical protein
MVVVYDNMCEYRKGFFSCDQDTDGQVYQLRTRWRDWDGIVFDVPEARRWLGTKNWLGIYQYTNWFKAGPETYSKIDDGRDNQ